MPTHWFISDIEKHRSKSNCVLVTELGHKSKSKSWFLSGLLPRRIQCHEKKAYCSVDIRSIFKKRFWILIKVRAIKSEHLTKTKFQKTHDKSQITTHIYRNVQTPFKRGPENRLYFCKIKMKEAKTSWGNRVVR